MGVCQAPLTHSEDSQACSDLLSQRTYLAATSGALHTPALPRSPAWVLLRGGGVTRGRKQPAWLEPGRPGQGWEFPPPSPIQAQYPFLFSFSSRLSIFSRRTFPSSHCTHSLASKSYDSVSSWALPSTPPQALDCLNCLL